MKSTKNDRPPTRFNFNLAPRSNPEAHKHTKAHYKMLATVIDSRIATLSKLLDQDGVLDEQQREALETFIQVVRNTPVAKVKKAAVRRRAISPRFDC